jgi:hypothetical protein
MKNIILILPLLIFEWEKGESKSKRITIGWLNKTYSFTW